MKKILLTLIAATAVTAAQAQPKAFYVKKGDEITKYNFGVAEDLLFGDNGTKLSVRGYGETIDLNAIDYISFSAPLGTAITPSEQKQKLVDIGSEAYSMIDVNDHADIMKMCHDFFDGEWDDKTYQYTPAPVEYDIDPSYYRVHGESVKAMRAAGSIVKGDVAAVRVLKAKVVNLYKMEDYYGIYTADKATEKWVKTAADHFEMRFTGRDGSTYAVSLKGSDDYTTWNTVDFNGQFPRTVNITFSKNAQELATARLTTTLVQSTSIDMALDFEAKGYVVRNELKVVDNGITDNVKVTVGGKQYATSTSKVSGRNLVNYDVLYDAFEATDGHYDEEGRWVDGDASRRVACFDRGEATADVLGKLQLKGRFAAPSRLNAILSDGYEKYNIYDKDGYTTWCYGKVLSSDGNSIHVCEEPTDKYERTAAYLNDYTDAGFYYDGDKALQGYFGYETGDEIEDRWVNDSEYDGYAIVDGRLLSIYREGEYDPATGSWIWGPWGYKLYGESGDPIFVAVDDSKVLHPGAIYMHYYNVEPMLLFPDRTSFAMDTFFDNTSFAKLVDDYNEIIDTYLSITGQTKDDK